MKRRMGRLGGQSLRHCRYSRREDHVTFAWRLGSSTLALSNPRDLDPSIRCLLHHSNRKTRRLDMLTECVAVCNCSTQHAGMPPLARRLIGTSGSGDTALRQAVEDFFLVRVPLSIYSGVDMFPGGGYSHLHKCISGRLYVLATGICVIDMRIYESFHCMTTNTSASRSMPRSTSPFALKSRLRATYLGLTMSLCLAPVPRPAAASMQPNLHSADYRLQECIQTRPVTALSQAVSSATYLSSSMPSCSPIPEWRPSIATHTLAQQFEAPITHHMSPSGDAR